MGCNISTIHRRDVNKKTTARVALGRKVDIEIGASSSIPGRVQAALIKRAVYNSSIDKR